MSNVGPAQVATSSQTGTGAFWQQPPAVFLYNGARFLFSTGSGAFPGANIRCFKSADGTPNSWSQVGGTGPVIRFNTSPTYIQHPTDPTKIIVAYCVGPANNGFIAYTTFDMSALAWGVPNVSTLNGDVDFTLNDAGLCVCVDYRASDGQLIFEYSGPNEIVGGKHYPRVYTTQANLVSGVWSAGRSILSGTAQSLHAAGLVVDPTSNNTYFIVFQEDPSSGPLTTAALFLSVMPSNDVIGALGGITSNVRLGECNYGYPKLRTLSSGADKELLIPFRDQATINIDIARAPLSTLIWTFEVAGTPPSDDFYGWPAVALDTNNNPNMFFDDGDNSCYVSIGGDPGVPWVQSTLWTGSIPDGDFFEKPTASSLSGIGVAGGFTRSQVSNSTQITADTFGYWYFEVQGSAPPPAPVPFISLKYVPAPGRPGKGISKFKKR